MNKNLAFDVALDALKKRFYREVEIKYLYHPLIDRRLPYYRFHSFVTRVVPNTPKLWPSPVHLDALVFVIPIPWYRSLWPINFEFPVFGGWKLYGRHFQDGAPRLGRWFDFQPIRKPKSRYV